MYKPLVSIIIPVYNVENYLKRCIDSVVNQSLRNIEIILIDDGSLDSSSKICDEYKVLDERITVIHKQNEGLGMARNTGIDIASGKYIAFVDSDDYIESNMYELLYNKAIISNSDVVFCNSVWEGINGNRINIIDYPEERTISDNIINFSRAFVIPNEELGHTICLTAWHGIYELSCIKKNNIRFISERFIPSEDKYFHLNLFKYITKVSFIPQILYHYCENSNSIVHTFNFNKYELWKNERSWLLTCFNDREWKEHTESFFMDNVANYLTCLVREKSISRKDKMCKIGDVITDKIWKEIDDYVSVNRSIINKSFLYNLIKFGAAPIIIYYYLIWKRKH